MERPEDTGSNDRRRFLATAAAVGAVAALGSRALAARARDAAQQAATPVSRLEQLRQQAKGGAP